MSNRTALRMRVLPRFPARITATNGLEVVQDNLDLVVRPDFGSLVQVPSVSSPTTTFFWAWDQAFDSYSSISFQNLVENIQDVIIGENLAGIAELTVSANQVPYYLDGDGTASTYTVSSFVRGISDAADEDEFLTGINAAPRNAITTGGTYLRFLSNKLGDVLSAEDFGVLKGVASDQSASMNDMIDAISQATSIAGGDFNQVTHEIDLGPGTIRIDNPLATLTTGVRIRGRGAAATKILAYGAFDVFSTQEFQTDGVTPKYHNSMRFEDFAIVSSDSANPSTGVRARGLIRNCGFERVGHQSCEVGFDIDNSWTLQMVDCFGGGLPGVTNHHIVLGTTVGGFIVNGGRYDVGEEPLLYAVGSDTLELFIINDAAFQFGKKGGIKVLSARTVRIDSAFLEGNCIGNPAEYYLDLNGSGSTLSSCEVRDVTLNNLADANRNGLGIARIDNFETAIFRERWSRNDVKPTPTIGGGVTRAEVYLQTANPMTASDLLNLSGPNAANASAVVDSVARPKRFYGKTLNGSNLSDTGSGIFGRLGEANVQLGVVDSGGEKMPSVQGTNEDALLDLNLQPFGGLILHGAFRKRLTSTGSNHVPSGTQACVLIDTSAGNRNIDLSAVTTWTAANIPIGFCLEVYKLVAANNVQFIAPTASSTFNGGAAGALKAVSAAGRYTLIKQTATAWLITYEAFA